MRPRDVTEARGPPRPYLPEDDVNDPHDAKPDVRPPREPGGGLLAWLAGGSLARMIVGGLALVPLCWIELLGEVAQSVWVAHLVSRGERVTGTTRTETGWRIGGDGGAVVQLAADDVRGGTYYECHDGHGGFGPPDVFGVLDLRLPTGRLLLVSPPETYGSGGVVGDLARELLAAGRIRGSWSLRSRPSSAALLLVAPSVPWVMAAWALWELRT